MSEPNTSIVRSESRSGKIAPVLAAPPPERTSVWVSVLKSFNPIGPIAEAYANTLAHRIESNRLGIELERVQSEARNTADVIDKSYRLKMEELQQRRLAVDRFFDTVQQQLENLHIERGVVLQMAQTANTRLLEPGLSAEERGCYKEVVIELVATIPQLASKGGETLKTLVDALPRVETSPHLLNS